MNAYQLIVIGGGPAGYNAAAYAAKKGMSVLLFEKATPGGVCLNEGCIPTKTLLNSAKILSSARHAADYGVHVDGDSFLSQAEVIARKNKVVKRLVTGVKAKLRAANVDVIQSAAEIVGRNNGLFEISSKEGNYFGERLLIAAGGVAALPPIKGAKEGLDSGLVLTNREILDLEEIPKSLVIIGAGVVGLEMAYYFAVCGCEVTVMEMFDKIAGDTEERISGVLKKSLEKKGIRFIMQATVTEISSDGGVSYLLGGEEKQIFAQRILLAAGRRAEVQGLGLENISVMTARNGIPTDEHMRTNIAGVWAAGDITGKCMLAHAAYREGEVAVNDMLGILDVMDYDIVPRVIYTSPEVAVVGKTLAEATECGIRACEINLSLMYSGRYIAENTEYTGTFNLVYNADDKTLIGAHIVGSYASEYIAVVSNLIGLKIPAEKIKRLVFPHPTVVEIVRDAVFEIE